MPRDHFSNVFKSPYFLMDKQEVSECKSFKCRIENLFVRFFNKEKR